MTLNDLTLPVDYATARQYALVFTGELAQALGAKWAEYGNTNCVPSPRLLTDGRWMLCADILTEIVPGGLLEAMWQHSDQQAVMAGVEVLPIADAMALLPQETPPNAP